LWQGRLNPICVPMRRRRPQSSHATTVGWDEPDAAERGPSPNALSVVVAIYLSGWIGSFGIVLFDTVAGNAGARGVSQSDLLTFLLAAFIGGVALPHVLEATTGEVGSYGGCVIAMLAGELVRAVLTAVVGLDQLMLPGALGFVVSLATIPWLASCYYVLKRIELRPPVSGGSASAVELASVLVPAAVMLVLCGLAVLAVGGRPFSLAQFSFYFLRSEKSIVEREVGDVHASASCERSRTIPPAPSYDPLMFSNPEHHTIHFYDCRVTFDDGTRLNRCVSYDTTTKILGTGYRGRRMCEAPPLPGENCVGPGCGKAPAAFSLPPCPVEAQLARAAVGSSGASRTLDGEACRESVFDAKGIVEQPHVESS
jgi:hypothetical protein